MLNRAKNSYLRNQITSLRVILEDFGICLQELDEPLERVPHLYPMICCLKNGKTNQVSVILLVR